MGFLSTQNEYKVQKQSHTSVCVVRTLLALLDANHAGLQTLGHTEANVVWVKGGISKHGWRGHKAA